MKRLLLAGLLACLSSLVIAQSSGASKEDELTLQVVLLKAQLAEATRLRYKCESEGSEATRLSQDAITGGQELMKALAMRGLTVDPQTNKIIAKTVDTKQ